MDLSEILCHPAPLRPSLSGDLQDSGDTTDDILTSTQRKQFFKMVHGRKVSSIAKHYPLPVDEDEIKVGVRRGLSSSLARLTHASP
jgi:hypothetical protein